MLTIWQTHAWERQNTSLGMAEQNQIWSMDNATTFTNKGMNHNRRYRSSWASSLTDKTLEETWLGKKESRVKSGYESTVQLPGTKVAQMGGICEPPWKLQLSVWGSCKGIDLDISSLQALAPEHYPVWPGPALYTDMNLDLLWLTCPINATPPYRISSWVFNFLPVPCLPV